MLSFLFYNNRSSKQHDKRQKRPVDTTDGDFITKSQKVPQDNETSFQSIQTHAACVMDAALFSANCSQLKFLLVSNREHQFFNFNFGLLTTSCLLQVSIGITLIAKLTLFNKEPNDNPSQSKWINFITLFGIYSITTINLVLLAFLTDK